MKKTILGTAVLLMGALSFGQKAELKLAEKALKKGEFSQALEALKGAESLMGSVDDKTKAKFYYVKGKAYKGLAASNGSDADLNESLAAFKNVLDSKAGSKYSKDVELMMAEMSANANQAALDAYNSGDFVKASDKFYQTYEMSKPEIDTTFLYYAAATAVNAKKYDNAIKYYNELIDLGYTGIETQYLATNKATGEEENMGNEQQMKLMVKAGTHEKGRMNVTESKRGDIIKNVALILVDQGKDEEAIKAIRAAREASPKDYGLLMTEANLYLKKGDKDKFKNLMEEAISMNPNDSQLYFNVGVITAENGDTAKAQEYYKKAIELDPKNGSAYMNMAVSILDKEKAIVEEMNNNLSNFDKYDALKLQQLEVYKEALPYLEKANQYMDKDLSVVQTLMNLYDNLEMKDKYNSIKAVYDSMK